MERWDRFESTPFKDSIDRHFSGFIRNPKTNRMIKVGSRGYKDQFQNLRRSEVVLVNAFGEGILWHMLVVCLKMSTPWIESLLVSTWIKYL